MHPQSHIRLTSCKTFRPVRGRGLFWGIELVADKDSKTCLPVHIPVAELLEAECLKRGVAVYPGSKGTVSIRAAQVSSTQQRTARRSANEVLTAPYLSVLLWLSCASCSSVLNDLPV